MYWEPRVNTCFDFQSDLSVFIICIAFNHLMAIKANPTDTVLFQSFSVTV